MPETATDPATGVVHIIVPGTSETICHKNTVGWSRVVTVAQLAGLVLTCEACNA